MEDLASGAPPDGASAVQKPPPNPAHECDCDKQCHDLHDDRLPKEIQVSSTQAEIITTTTKLFEVRAAFRKPLLRTKCFHWYFLCPFFSRTSTNISATRISQCCVGMHPPSICQDKAKDRRNTSVSKPSTAAVIAMRCFTNAWITSPTLMDFACAVHTNVRVSALTSNHIRSCLTLPRQPSLRMTYDYVVMSIVIPALQSSLLTNIRFGSFCCSRQPQ